MAGARGYDRGDGGGSEDLRSGRENMKGEWAGEVPLAEQLGR